MEKFSNKEVKEQILAAFGKEIEKRGEFQTAGIAFFGYEFEVSLKLTLVARGERKVEITVNGGEGYDAEHPQEDGPQEYCRDCECPRDDHWIGADGDDVRNCKNALTCNCPRPSDKPTKWNGFVHTLKKVEITIPVSGRGGKKTKKEKHEEQKRIPISRFRNNQEASGDGGSNTPTQAEK